MRSAAGTNAGRETEAEDKELDTPPRFLFPSESDGDDDDESSAKSSTASFVDIFSFAFCSFSVTTAVSLASDATGMPGAAAGAALSTVADALDMVAGAAGAVGALDALPLGEFGALDVAAWCMSVDMHQASAVSASDGAALASNTSPSICPFMPCSEFSLLTLFFFLGTFWRFCVSILAFFRAGSFAFDRFLCFGFLVIRFGLVDNLRLPFRFHHLFSTRTISY